MSLQLNGPSVACKLNPQAHNEAAVFRQEAFGCPTHSAQIGPESRERISLPMFCRTPRSSSLGRRGESASPPPRPATGNPRRPPVGLCPLPQILRPQTRTQKRDTEGTLPVSDREISPAPPPVATFPAPTPPSPYTHTSLIFQHSFL